MRIYIHLLVAILISAAFGSRPTPVRWLEWVVGGLCGTSLLRSNGEGDRSAARLGGGGAATCAGRGAALAMAVLRAGGAATGAVALDWPIARIYRPLHHSAALSGPPPHQLCWQGGSGSGAGPDAVSRR